MNPRGGRRADYNQQQLYKKCPFCVHENDDNDDFKIDYKNTKLLKRFTTERGKIKTRRVTGVCVQHQHQLANAIKRSRFMALMPFVVKVQSTPGGRRGRR
ncbi:MAG: 30S ribosomal protein S18 [Coriobacteriales bacterium]|nr:30S ribosomal protein S18 [Coriobacteriales bacterium]